MRGRSSQPIAGRRPTRPKSSSITSNLATLEATRVVDENAKDLAKYGLAEPAVEVAFKAAGDKDYRRLFVGGKTPTGGDLYAKLANDSKVLLIPAYLESSLDRSRSSCATRAS